MSENRELVSLEELLERKQKCDQKLEEIQNRKISPEIDNSVDADASYDLYIIDNILYLDIDLPGVFEKDIDILFLPPKLVISGKFPTPVTLEGRDYIVQKRKLGRFEYKFRIPEKKIIGTYDTQINNGIFHLRFRLIASAEQKKLSQD